MDEKVIKIDDNCYKYGYITWTRDNLIDTLSRGFNLKNLDKTLRADKELVMAAVKGDGKNLYWASKELKDDKEIALNAIKYGDNVDAFKYVSDRLKSDRDIALAAVEYSAFNIRLVGDELKHDADFIKEACIANYDLVKYRDVRDLRLDAETRQLIDSAKKMIEENKPSLSSVLGKAEKASQEHNSKLNTPSKDDKDLEK